MRNRDSREENILLVFNNQIQREAIMQYYILGHYFHFRYLDLALLLSYHTNKVRSLLT